MRSLLVALLALLILSAVAVGCFTLDIHNGEILCSGDTKRECPSGYRCIDDHCWSTTPDGGEDDSGL